MEKTTGEETRGPGRKEAPATKKEEVKMDEFEKRMYFSSFVSTLADTVTKMNPITLVGSEGRQELEQAGLKDQYQAAMKKWLDLLMGYSSKAQKLGEKYPIEKLLGIEES